MPQVHIHPWDLDDIEAICKAVCDEGPAASVHYDAASRLMMSVRQACEVEGRYSRLVEQGMRAEAKALGLDITGPPENLPDWARKIGGWKP